MEKFMYKSFKKSLCNSSLKELDKKFYKKYGFEIYHQDVYGCGCDCYDYDDDHFSDDWYNNEFDYVMSRTNLFYENIQVLSKFFKPEFIEKLKNRKDIEFDVVEAFFDIEIDDLIEGYNSTYLNNFFDEKNKYGLKIKANIRYKDYDFMQVSVVNICIKNPFQESSRYKDYYNFNIFQGKHTYLREHSLDFILRRMIKKNTYRRKKQYLSWITEEEPCPIWCETNEECLMYYLLTESGLDEKLFETFDVKELVKEKESMEVFRMYLD